MSRIACGSVVIRASPRFAPASVASLAARALLALRIEPRRDRARLVLAEAAAPCRHLAAAPVPDRADHAREVPAVEPVVVGQVRRAERGHARAVDAVTRGA